MFRLAIVAAMLGLASFSVPSLPGESDDAGTTPRSDYPPTQDLGVPDIQEIRPGGSGDQESLAELSSPKVKPCPSRVDGWQNYSSVSIMAHFTCVGTMKFGGSVDLQPGDILGFAYPGSTWGDTCNDSPPPRVHCVSCVPQKLTICSDVCTDVFNCFKDNGNNTIPQYLLHHPQAELVTDVYADLFAVQVNDKLVRGLTFTDETVARLESFAVENGVYEAGEEVTPGRYVYPPIYSYQTIEFDAEGVAHPKVEFALEPTVALLVDGQLQNRTVAGLEQALNGD